MIFYNVRKILFHPFLSTYNTFLQLSSTIIYTLWYPKFSSSKTKFERNYYRKICSFDLPNIGCTGRNQDSCIGHIRPITISRREYTLPRKLQSRRDIWLPVLPAQISYRLKKLLNIGENRQIPANSRRCAERHQTNARVVQWDFKVVDDVTDELFENVEIGFAEQLTGAVQDDCDVDGIVASWNIEKIDKSWNSNLQSHTCICYSQ